MRSGLVFTLLISAVALATPARAQEGLATSSSVGGHNTVQQAPSGGTTQGTPGAGSRDAAAQGQPTSEEHKVEQRNDAATQICKGC